jgi:hypothetical protein
MVGPAPSALCDDAGPDALAVGSGNQIDATNLLLRARLRPGSLGRNGLEVELAFALLVEHALASGAAATHVHPIGGHHHNRSRPCIVSSLRQSASLMDRPGFRTGQNCFHSALLFCERARTVSQGWRDLRRQVFPNRQVHFERLSPLGLSRRVSNELL